MVIISFCCQIRQAPWQVKLDPTSPLLCLAVTVIRLAHLSTYLVSTTGVKHEIKVQMIYFYSLGPSIQHLAVCYGAKSDY